VGPEEALSTIRRTLQRGKRATAASLARTSLFWRELPDTLGTRIAALFDTLFDGLSGVLLGTAVTITLTDLRLFGVGIDVLLYLYLVSVFLPLYLPDPEHTDGLVGGNKLVSILCVYVLALGYPTSTLAPELLATSPVEIVARATGIPVQPPSPSGFIWYLIGWVIIGWSTLSVYIYATWWRRAPIEARIEFLVNVAPTDYRRTTHLDAHHRQSDAVNRISDVFAIIGISGVIMFTCLVFAIMAGVAVVLFPLPEVVIILTAIASSVNKIRSSMWIETVADYGVVIEDQLFTVVRYVRAGPKGFAATSLIFSAVAMSMLQVYLSLLSVAYTLRLLPLNTDSLSQVFFRIPLTLTVLGLTISCLIVPGLYSIWYWLRELKRLPHFLDYWESQYRPDKKSEHLAGPDPPPTRPPGTLIIPTLLFIPIFLVNVFQPLLHPLSMLVPILLFAIVLFSLVVWSITWTIRTSPQEPQSDSWAIPVAGTIQFSWLIGLFWISWQDGAWGAPSALLVTALIFGLELYFSPEIESILHQKVGRFGNDIANTVLGVSTLGIGAIWVIFIDSALSWMLFGSGILVTVVPLGSILLKQYTSAVDIEDLE